MPTHMNDNSVCEEHIFRKMHKDLAVRIANFLFYKLGDLEKAKDFTQEAFVKLWENCRNVPVEKAKSFLYTVANNRFLDEVSHQKVQLKFQQRMKSTESRMENNPEYIYRQDDFKTRLEEAISRLPEKQRTVFLMSRIDKMQNKEIAGALDISIKAVEKHITGALKRLKQALDELENRKI